MLYNYSSFYRIKKEVAVDWLQKIIQQKQN
nr:MAG TPA: hypothetical protein [Caudoviricetes sp.]